MTPETIKATRRKLGLTQAEWARWLGICEGHALKIERGKVAITPTIRVLATLYAKGAKPPHL